MVAAASRFPAADIFYRTLLETIYITTSCTCYVFKAAPLFNSYVVETRTFNLCCTAVAIALLLHLCSTLSGPQSRFGDNPVNF